MATVAAPPMTAEEFFEWANRPENLGGRYELDNGEVVELPSPGELHGVICWLVSHLLGDYIFRRRGGYLLTNDTGLIVGRGPDSVRGPDVMLFLESRPLSQMNLSFCDRVPPLVVEVYSPTDRPGKLSKRIGQYQRRGVPLVWVVYPEDRTVSVYRLGEPPDGLDESDELTGNGVLPDFHCRVADLFALPGSDASAAPVNPT